MARADLIEALTRRRSPARARPASPPGERVMAGTSSATVGSEAPSIPETSIDPDTLKRVLPPYAVILHNDDHNSMDHVVRAIVLSVPSLTVERAAEIMLQAHNHGQAVVITCPKEAAEHYRERLEGFGLTATIEPA